MLAHEKIKTLVQCDFDGTITVEDVSFLLLDGFADNNWRQVLELYREGKISVGHFNSRAFAMIKANKENLIEYMKPRVKIREGLSELLAVCRRRGFRFVVVSNGLDFYIETIFRHLGLTGIEVHAARTSFKGSGMEVEYVGPSGEHLDDGFKETYTRLFMEEGYRTLYVGNGVSDFPAASLAYRVFAIDSLLDYCRQMKLGCVTFHDLADLAGMLERL